MEHAERREKRRKREGNHFEEENGSGGGLGVEGAFWEIGEDAVGTDGLEVGDIVGMVDGVDEDMEIFLVGSIDKVFGGERESEVDGRGAEALSGEDGARGGASDEEADGDAVILDGAELRFMERGDEEIGERPVMIFDEFEDEGFDRGGGMGAFEFDIN